MGLQKAARVILQAGKELRGLVVEYPSREIFKGLTLPSLKSRSMINLKRNIYLNARYLKTMLYLVEQSRKPVLTYPKRLLQKHIKVLLNRKHCRLMNGTKRKWVNYSNKLGISVKMQRVPCFWSSNQRLTRSYNTKFLPLSQAPSFRLREWVQDREWQTNIKD